VKDLGRKVGLFLLACVISLAVLEGVSRIFEIWWPTQAIDYGLGFTPESRLFVIEEGSKERVRTNEAKRQAFIDQSLSLVPEDRVFRMAVLGGSSVLQLQAELKGLSSALEKLEHPGYERVEVVNAGGNSYGSQRLIPILAELLKLQVQLVVIYSGHNEFEEVEQLQLAGLDSVGFQRTLAKLAIYRRIRDWVQHWQLSALRSEHNDRILKRHTPDHARAWKHPFTEEDAGERMAAFEQNLQRMVLMARGYGVPVVLATVPSNLVSPYLPKRALQRYQVVFKRLEAGRYKDALSLGRLVLAASPGRHQSSDQENSVIRDVARENLVPLADVEAAVIAVEPHGVPGESLFADHCHLNQAGRELWLKTLLPVVAENYIAIPKP
jgi:lysophospholipase L1-like esterase